MHPYEIASTLRERGKELSIKINWGSLYTVVQNLEKHGFIEVTGTDRHGRRPERTVYGITESGQRELKDWMRELVGVPEKEYPRFEAALSLLGVLPPDEVVELLQQRLDRLTTEITRQQTELTRFSAVLPRLFLVEGEYAVAMLRAEAEWTRSLITEIRDGSLPGVPEWRSMHETGQFPEKWTDLGQPEGGAKD